MYRLININIFIRNIFNTISFQEIIINSKAAALISIKVEKLYLVLVGLTD